MIAFWHMDMESRPRVYSDLEVRAATPEALFIQPSLHAVAVGVARRGQVLRVLRCVEEDHDLAVLPVLRIQHCSSGLPGKFWVFKGSVFVVTHARTRQAGSGLNPLLLRLVLETRLCCFPFVWVPLQSNLTWLHHILQPLPLPRKNASKHRACGCWSGASSHMSTEWRRLTVATAH